MNKLQNPVLLAKIGAPHGVRGELRVTSFTEAKLSLGDYGSLYTDKGQKFTVAKARPAKNVLVVSFKEITSRELAEQCRGQELYVERASLPEPDDEDEFYVGDLIGMQAVDRSGEVIGKIAAIENFGAGDLLEITPISTTGNLAGANWFITFTHQNVPEIDLDIRRVTLIRPSEVSERDQNLSDGQDREGR